MKKAPPSCRCVGADWPGPVDRFIVAGVSHRAPSAWIMGRAQARSRDGETPMQALRGAINDWAETCTWPQA